MSEKWLQKGIFLNIRKFRWPGQKTGSFGLNPELARIDTWKHFNARQCRSFGPTGWWPWPFTCNVFKGRPQNQWRRVRAWYPIGPPAFLSDGKSPFNVLVQKEFEMSRKVLAAKRKSLEKSRQVQQAKGHPLVDRWWRRQNLQKWPVWCFQSPKPYREPCGSFCPSILASGPEIKAANCVGETWN